MVLAPFDPSQGLVVLFENRGGPFWSATQASSLVGGGRLEASMSDDLDEEERGILRRLFDAVFGRSGASEEDIGSDIHRLGDLKQRRAREND